MDGALLERNLRALATAGSDLAERLAWPARSSHVMRSAAGERLRGGMSVSLSSTEQTELIAKLRPEREPLLLGIGAGDFLPELLATSAARVTIWDRDPWLLRLCLSEHDLADSLISGRLALALGVDLLEHLETPRTVVWHPRLRGIYRMEAELVAQGVTPRRAALCVDRLLGEEVSRSLRASGLTPVPIDLEGWSLEELSLAVQRSRCEVVVGINYVTGLAEFCRAERRRLLCWEVDPSTSRLAPAACETDHCAIFTYRAAHVSEFERAGFTRVRSLPLASDPELRKPLQLSDEERETLGSGVTFVGSSLAPEANRARVRLDALYSAWHPRGAESLPEAHERLERALAAQRLDFSSFTLEAHLMHELGDFVRALREGPEREDPVVLAAQLAAAEKRRSYVTSLAHTLDTGISVWGDLGWRDPEALGVRYRGYAGHYRDLTRIYAAASINLDVGRLYQSDIVTLRVFDVLACGGFLIAEHCGQLEELFRVGVELESYRDLDELRDKVRHYAARPAAREAIARRGREAVCSRHTVRDRMRSVLETLPSLTFP